MVQSVSSKFVLNQGEYNRLTRSKDGDVYKHLQKIAAQLESRAKAQAPKNTGALAASIRSTVEQHDGEIAIRVGSPLGYALLVHEGTRPHVISARAGKLLRFTVRGRIVYARRVFHPGTRANRFLTDNLRKVI